MPKTIALTAALSATLLALALTACSSPAPGPAEPADQTPTSAADPVGTGDWTPDDAWFASLDERTTWLDNYVGYWDAQECDMAKVIDGDFNCNIQISGLIEGIDDLDALLVQTVDVTAADAATVEGLADARRAAADGATHTTAYLATSCDLLPDDSCTDVGDALVQSARDLDAALATWTKP